MQNQLASYQSRVNQALTECIQHYANQQLDNQHPLFEAIHYATLNSGKRLRPALIYAVGEALGISLEKLDSAACAIELVHSYSLVHDDLPAMDNDDLRRGKPTCHIQYDEATAILVGDAQQSLAIELLTEDQALQAKDALELIRILTSASGALGMISGQMLDIESESKQIAIEQLQTLHLLKTGRLIQAALLMGAVQDKNYQQLKPTLLLLGEQIGLAFQVQDDILDIEGDTETLGKPQGSDLQLDKSTYPKLLGLQQAKDYRDNLIKQAKTTLAKLDVNIEFLTELIDYIANRKY